MAALVRHFARKELDPAQIDKCTLVSGGIRMCPVDFAAIGEFLPG